MMILNPTAPAPPIRFVELPRSLASLAGCTVAVLSNRWKSMDFIAKRLSERLQSEQKVAHVRIEAVPINGGAPSSILDSVAENTALAIVGLANCGSCTAWSVHDQIALIRRGVPAVVLVTERFVALANATRRSNGVPDAPMIVLPRTESIEYSGEEAMEVAAATTFSELLARFSGSALL
jgi:hypothetical protein